MLYVAREKNPYFFHEKYVFFFFFFLLSKDKSFFFVFFVCARFEKLKDFTLTVSCKSTNIAVMKKMSPIELTFIAPNAI